MTNPYAKFLGDRNPREVIGHTASQLSAHAARLSASLTRNPAAGKWSARDILAHLADCEVVFAFRLRQALSQPNHIIQPFDQDSWAATYPTVDAHAALAVFSSVRAWNTALIASLTAEQRAKTLNHPERGDMTVETVVETMAGHDLNHLQQLEAIA